MPKNPAAVTLRQIVLTVVGAMLLLPTGIVGLAFGLTCLLHPSELPRNPWWFNLWGVGAVALALWAARKKRSR